MTIDDLKALIAHGESACLEFKATTGQRTEGAKAVCAMLNGQGGHVLFRVNDRGDLKGQLVTAHTQEEVDRELRRLEPRPSRSLRSCTCMGTTASSFSRSPPAPRAPSLSMAGPISGRAPRLWSCRGTDTKTFCLNGYHATRRWENDPVPPGVGLKDLDHDEIRRVLNAAIQRGRMEQPLEQNVPAILRGQPPLLGPCLLQQYRATAAGIRALGQGE